jgi:hypothetical protein
LHHPICGRMSRDVEMQDSTAFVLDDEETVQHSETRGRNGEEVEGDDGLAVVVKRCEPFLACVAAPLRSRQIGRPPRLRDVQRQYRRKPARCQPTTVSGLTITNASRQ